MRTEKIKFYSGIFFLSIIILVSMNSSIGADNIPVHIKDLIFNYLGFNEPVKAAILETDLKNINQIEGNLWGGGLLIPQGYLEIVKGQNNEPKFYYMTTS